MIHLADPALSVLSLAERGEKPQVGSVGSSPQCAVESVTLPATDLLGESELARLLGKSLRTIRRWSVERRAPLKVKLGRSVFYRRESVLKWIAAQEEGVES